MRYALPLAALSLLAACAAGPQPVWLKPGTPALAAEQDFLACAAQAGREFPDRRRIGVSPRITLGGGICDGGICVGASNGAEVYDYDRNAPLRERAVAACMAAKGYAEAELPACRGSITPLQSQPFDTRGTCVAGGRIAAP